MEKYYDNTEWYHSIPLMLVTMIMPLIVRLKVIPLKGDFYYFWNGQKSHADFFSYYKMMWLVLFTIAVCIMIGVKVFQEGKQVIRKTSIYIPMLTYSVFVMISAFLSEHKDIAMNGFVDRHEGMYILLIYMVLLFGTINLMEREKHIKIMLAAIFTGAVVIAVIGIFQYMGMDIWKSDFGKDMIVPSQYNSYKEKLEFTTSGNQIYSTLYHYNYVGSYISMLFPLAFSMFILTKNKKLKITMCVVALLMAATGLGSGARSGIIGVGIALLMFLVINLNYIKKNWKLFVSIIAVLIGVFIILNISSKGALGKRLSTILTDIKQITETSKNIEYDIPLKDISVKGNTATIVTNSETLVLKNNEGNIEFQDDKGNAILHDINYKSGMVQLKNMLYKDYQVQIGELANKNAVVVKKGNIRFYFELTKDDNLNLIDNKGRIVSLDFVESWGFKGKEKLGSARGYIWSRSIPLLKNTIIKGYGPDNFSIYFPQNDFKGKMYAYGGDMWHIVDKPHNLYLQIALNTGVISLLAVLAIFIMYAVNSFKIYFNNTYEDFLSIAGVSIFIAVCGYLGASFFNDSVVSVAPVFWILLGMGIATNYMIKPNKAVKQK